MYVEYLQICYIYFKAFSSNMRYIFWCSDISNNNFEWENSSPTECPRGSMYVSFKLQVLVIVNQRGYHQSNEFFFPETLSRATPYYRQRSKMQCFEHNFSYLFAQYITLIFTLCCRSNIHACLKRNFPCSTDNPRKCVTIQTTDYSCI